MPGFAVAQSSPMNLPTSAAPGPAPVPFLDAALRSADDEWNVNRAAARGEQVRSALWARDTQILKATGARLPPPDDAVPLSGLGRLMGPVLHPVMHQIGMSQAADDYEAAVDKLRAEHPGAMAGIETREAMMTRLQAGWNAKAARAAEAGTTLEGTLGSFVGGSGANLAEPGNLAVMAVTGGAGAARPLAARLLTQGVINAGMTAAQAPGRIAASQQYGGPQYGVKEAAGDVALSGVGGALFEGLHTGARALSRPIIRQFGGLKPDISAVTAGGPDLAPSGGPSGGPSVAPQDAPALKRASQVLDAAHRDDAAIGAQAGADHAEATASLDAHEPPPLAPVQDLTEITPSGGALSATDYRGRTIYGGTFDPRELAADPVRFQYKGDGDAEGVTARLRGVDAWDATASGKVIVYEDRGGQQFIADGHQRRGLALRMEDQGFDARLDGYLFREADGWTPGEVRTVAALKNIREGAGAPLDAAKVLREAPDAINDRSLPVSGEFMGQARGLALLSDPAFRAVVNHVIPERYGAEIGLMASTRPDLHEAIVGLLHAAEPANADEARALVVEALQDDWIRHEGDQADLFGYDPSQSAMIARAKIAASVKRSLSSSSKLFGGLVRNADAIEAGGNALARDANEARLAVDRAALEVTAKLALRAGPVGEAMQAAVAKVHAGETPANAAKAVLARVREAIEAGERLDEARGVSLDPQPPSPAAEALLTPFDDPAAGHGPEAQAKMATEDTEIAAEHPGLFDDLAVDDRHEKAHQALSACAPAGE